MLHAGGEDRQPSRADGSSWAFRVLCVAAFVLVFRSAWLSDDAFITLRVVDHFLSGHGLRWNVDERVQVYTHPLWMLMTIPFYALWLNPYAAFTSLSFFCCLAAAFGMCRAAGASRLAVLCCAAVPLAFSRTVHDYAACGLEVPMVWALIAWFYAVYLREGRGSARLYLLASLVLLTRLDVAVMLAPALAHAGLAHLRQGGWFRAGLAGFSPLLAWFVFSLVYYGFFLPNTKYAKLGSGISAQEYAQQGLYYVRNFLHYDWLAAAWMGLALALAAFRQWQAGLRATPSGMLAAGIVLQVCYVVAVGGDYMAGRFFALPYGACVLLFLAQQRLDKRGLLTLAAIAALVGAMHYRQHDYEVATDIGRDHYIVEERQYYLYCSSVFFLPESGQRECWLLDQLNAYLDSLGDLEAARNSQGWIYYQRQAVGMTGYYGGADIIMVDEHGLADALLARLPTVDIGDWRIGHFARYVPEGYREARMEGDTSKLHPALREYYQKLRLLTSAPLLSKERWRAIWGFQRGEYDALLARYVEEHGGY